MTSATETAELEARLQAAREPGVAPVVLVDALIDLAWVLRLSDIPRAHSLATEARALAIEAGYILGQARATRTMAMTPVDSADVPKILTLAEEAKQRFDEAGDLVGQAASRDFLASIHEHLGNLNVGLDYALDALELARTHGDPVRQGYALSSVGGILAASGETDAAVERLREGLRLFEEVDDTGGILAICTRLSRVHRDNGELDAALTYAERARAAAKALLNHAGDWGATTVMAEVEEGRGRLDEAERLHRRALQGLPTALSEDILGSETRVALGRLHIKQGRLDEAEAELKTALQRVADNPVSVVTEAETRETLSQLYEKQSRWQEALAHLRTAKALRENIAQQDTQNKLDQMKVRATIDAAQKDAEIHRLRYVELHEAQTKLVEAEKMALMGRLAAGTAHELNTPLGVLRSHLSLMTTAADRLIAAATSSDGESRRARLIATLADGRRASEAALERIATIVANFQRFAQLDQAERRPFDLSESVLSALQMIESDADGVEFVRQFEPVPQILGWPREVNFALMTILRNAVQAIDGAGTVTVQVDADDRNVYARIVDTGRGMSAEQVEHLFDVGWSQAGPRTRMRFGLAAAYATMKRHGGHIEVHSSLGCGTTVTLRWPSSGPS